jgi:hypothetical protein
MAAPARSHLYRADGNGGWTPDSVNDRAVASLGLVSQAIFTDLDGDGRPELVSTSEWGPIRVLHNDAGRLRDVTAEWGLKDVGAGGTALPPVTSMATADSISW